MSRSIGLWGRSEKSTQNSQLELSIYMCDEAQAARMSKSHKVSLEGAVAPTLPSEPDSSKGPEIRTKVSKSIKKNNKTKVTDTPESVLDKWYDAPQ